MAYHVRQVKTTSLTELNNAIKDIPKDCLVSINSSDITRTIQQHEIVFWAPEGFVDNYIEPRKQQFIEQ